MDYFVSSMKVHKVGISYLISQRQGSGNLANISKASEIVIMEAEWLLLPVWQQRCMQFLDIRLIVLAGGGGIANTYILEWGGCSQGVLFFKK